MAEFPSEIIAEIKRSQNILVTAHIFPDADALGSQLALGNVLKAMGKNVVLYSEAEVPYTYAFMPGGESLVHEIADPEAFDCAIALDCGDSFRLGKRMEELLAMHPFIVIDHHAGHRNFGDLRWVDPHRASTGEMVYDLITAGLGARISYDTAFCLYAAIVSDTGSFKYSSTSQDTFRVAGELVALGVQPSVVAGKLFDNFSVNRLQLLKEVLETLTLYEDDRLAFISVSREMFAKTGAYEEDTEMFINYPRSLGSVKIAAFIKEAKDGRIGVSMRSKGDTYDVSLVARMFGGGGHRNAAGFKLANSSIGEVTTKLLKELRPLVAA